MTPNHAAARLLAQSGTPVFPCMVGGKRPATARGFKDATADIAQIDAWWGEANYNVAFSPESIGLCVVDVEREALAAWATYEIENDLEPTYAVRTPGGGLHLYYWGSLPPTQGALGEKIDTRGRGSYVLVPPSRVNGVEYVEIGGEVANLPPCIAEGAAARERERQEAPDGLVLDHPASLDKARARIEVYLERGDVAREGEAGDLRTYQLAAEMGDLGLSEEMAAKVMGPWNDACEPSWDQDELAAKIASGYHNRQNALGCYTDTAPPSAVFADLLASLPDEPEPAAAVEYRAWTVSEIAALPPQQWLIKDVLPLPGVGVLYAPYSAGKTFAAIALSAPLAAAGRDVVYLAGEGKRGVGERARAWSMLNGAELDRLRIVDRMPQAADNAQIGRFCADIYLQGLRPSLVIIDTAARMMRGLDESSARDMGQFVAAMDQIRDLLKCCVLAVHHTGKDEGRGMRGSSAIGGGMDFLIELQRAEDANAFALQVVKQKEAERLREPLCFRGANYLDTLVYAPISAAAYREMTGDGGIGKPLLAGVLRAMGAFEAVGKDAATTYHLAARLVLAQSGEDGTPEQVGAMQAQLSRLGSGPLRAYTNGQSGDRRRWGLVGA